MLHDQGIQKEGTDNATQQSLGKTLLQPTRRCGSVRAGQIESAKPSSSPPEGAEVSELADIKLRLLAGHNFKKHIKHLDAQKHPKAIRRLR